MNRQERILGDLSRLKNLLESQRDSSVDIDRICEQVTQLIRQRFVTLRFCVLDSVRDSPSILDLYFCREGTKQYNKSPRKLDPPSGREILNKSASLQVQPIDDSENTEPAQP